MLVVLAALLAFALAATYYGPIKVRYAILVLSFACDASFAWGSTRFFRRNGGKLLPYQRWALAVTYGTALLHGAGILYAFHSSSTRFFIGVGLYLTSLALFWSAVLAASGSRLQFFFASEPSDGLVDRGPYRLVRHPFYVAYTLAWIAGTIATGQAILAISVVLNFAFYYHAATLEESQFDDSPLAQRYRAYCARTGMFLPRLGWGTASKPTPDESLEPLRRHVRDGESRGEAVVARFAGAE